MENYKDFADKINSSGFALDQKPYYNEYALWVTMNILMFDYSSLFNKWIKENCFEFVFDLATSKLMNENKKNG